MSISRKFYMNMMALLFLLSLSVNVFAAGSLKIHPGVEHSDAKISLNFKKVHAEALFVYVSKVYRKNIVYRAKVNPEIKYQRLKITVKQALQDLTKKLNLKAEVTKTTIYVD